MFSGMAHSRTVQEVDQVIHQAKLKPGARILDLACGQGRHVLEFTKRGCHVVGLDYSRSYIDRAKMLLKRCKYGEQARVVRGDMRHLDRYFRPASFDAVVFLYNSFGYFAKRSDDTRVLRHVARVLKPGGTFVLNTLNRPGVEYRLRGLMAKANLDAFYMWMELEPKVYFLDRAAYDPQTRRTQAVWLIVDMKKRAIKRFHFSQSVYSHQELKTTLGRLGFRIESLWGQLSGGRFHRHAWHQSFVARKVK